MRNLSVLIQEFRRAVRGGSTADGIPFINEAKDDRRLALWTKNCTKIEEHTKAQFTHLGGGYREER